MTTFNISRRHLLAMGTVGAAFAATGAVRAQGASMPISIAMSSTSLGFAPLRIADRGGFFKRHDLDASIKTMDNGNLAMAALLSRSVDFATPSLGEALLARARGRPIVIISNINRGMGNSLILSRKVADRLGVGPDSPLEGRLKALNGVKIAFASATSPTYAAFGGAVASVGAKVDPIYMGQQAMIPAIESGIVDGIVTSPPNWVAPVVNGTAYLFVGGREVPADINTGSTTAVQALEDYASDNPQIIKAVQDALADAVNMIATETAKAEELITSLYPKVDPAGVSLAFRQGIPGWVNNSLRPDDITREVAILKSSGQAIPGIEDVDPAALLKYSR